LVRSRQTFGLGHAPVKGAFAAPGGVFDYGVVFVECPGVFRMAGPLVSELLAARYRITGQLGSGAEGLVWEAYDESLKLPVAIKQLSLPAKATEEQEAQLLAQAKSEARHTGQLAHANIVAVFDVFSESGSVWVVMPRIIGRSLADEIAAGGLWSPPQAARLGVQLAGALIAAHAAGVTHGKVQPSNVLIPELGAPLLTDFSHKPAPAQADMAGLGALLFFTVEGHLPPAGEPAAPRNAGPITEVITGLIAAEITFDQAREQLTEALSATLPKQRKTKKPPAMGVPEAAPAEAGAAPNRRGLKIAAAAVAVAAIAGIAFAVFRSPGAQDPGTLATSPLPSSAVPDTTAPQRVVNVLISGRSTDAVTLTWDGGIDNTGVTQYRVLRDGVQAGVTPTPDYTDTGLAVNTAYTYTVTAVDAAGNVSAASEPAAATTLAVPDTAKPTAPGSPRVIGRSTTSIVLTWNAASDNIGVARYQVRRDGNPVATVAGLRYTDTGLAPGTSHSYAVVAIDATGNISDPSAQVTGLTLTAPDTTAPGAPGSPHVTGSTTTTIGLAWAASTDDIGVTGYLVYRNGTLVASPTTLAYTDPGLTPGTTYAYQVKAVDGAGNVSAAAPLSAATVAPQVSGITAAVAVGGLPGCVATVTASVSVTAGPVNVDLQIIINGVTSTTTVSFPGTGPASQTVDAGTGSSAQDGTVQISSTAPNPVSASMGWTALAECRPGFTVTSPSAGVPDCSPPVIVGSVQVVAQNNAGPEQYTVRMLVEGNVVATTTITVPANSAGTASLTTPDPYDNGTYAVSFEVLPASGPAVSTGSETVEVNC
jgi:chitodextrinase